MQHILINPHNGAHVEHDGVSLAPGQQVLVGEREAHSLVARFGFLLLHLVEKTGLKAGKPQKIVGTLTWQHANLSAPDMESGEHVPTPDTVQHVAKTAAPKKAAKKTAKKAAK